MGWSIEIPKVDANVTRALVVKWLAQVGDRVAAGDPLVEIETEKAVFVIDAERAGVLRAIHAPPGTRVPVGAVIGMVGDEGDDSTIAPTEHQWALSVAAERSGESGGSALCDKYASIDYGEALLGDAR